MKGKQESSNHRSDWSGLDGNQRRLLEWKMFNWTISLRGSLCPPCRIQNIRYQKSHGFFFLPLKRWPSKEAHKVRVRAPSLTLHQPLKYPGMGQKAPHTCWPWHGHWVWGVWHSSSQRSTTPKPEPVPVWEHHVLSYWPWVTFRDHLDVWVSLSATSGSRNLWLAH